MCSLGRGENNYCFLKNRLNVASGIIGLLQISSAKIDNVNGDGQLHSVYKESRLSSGD